MIEECVGGTRHNFDCGGWLLCVVDGCCVCVRNVWRINGYLNFRCCSLPSQGLGLGPRRKRWVTGECIQQLKFSPETNKDITTLALALFTNIQSKYVPLLAPAVEPPRKSCIAHSQNETRQPLVVVFNG